MKCYKIYGNIRNRSYRFHQRNWHDWRKWFAPYILSLASVICIRNSKRTKGRESKNCIIGTGSRGLYHIHNLLKTSRAEIVALCDIYRPPLDEATVLFPKAKKYKDYREVLAPREVEDILVACFLHLHAVISIARLKAGKHVFCEKTMARTFDQCKEMYDTYKQTGKVLHISHQRLFDSKYIKALEMVHKGTIKNIVGLCNFWFRNNDWRKRLRGIGVFFLWFGNNRETYTSSGWRGLICDYLIANWIEGNGPNLLFYELCFFISFALNVFSIIVFKTEIKELYTQIGFVLLISIFYSPVISFDLLVL